MTSMQAIIITKISNLNHDQMVKLLRHVVASFEVVKGVTYVIVVNRTRKNDTCDTISGGSVKKSQPSNVLTANIERSGETHSKAILSEDIEFANEYIVLLVIVYYVAC